MMKTFSVLKFIWFQFKGHENLKDASAQERDQQTGLDLSSVDSLQWKLKKKEVPDKISL